MRLVVMSGSRADFGILKNLIQKIRADKFFDLTLITTDFFCEDFQIDKRFEVKLESDTATGISKSLGLAIMAFSEHIKGDMLLILGDRFEAFAAATVAHISGIPIAHIHGGELTFGAYDDAFRHSITKMSSLHFVVNDTYRKRVIQLGEHPGTVFPVGALGCDGLVKRKEQPKKPFYIVIYHPETVGEPRTLELNLKGKVLYIGSGYDKNSSKIGFENAIPHLPREKFIEYLSEATAIIGNSSSGIIEAPALGVPSINIGNRQSGRMKADSVIDCENNKKSISSALKTLHSDDFQRMMSTDYWTPYQGVGVAESIIDVLKTAKISGKRFYDLP